LSTTTEKNIGQYEPPGRGNFCVVKMRIPGGLKTPLKRRSNLKNYKRQGKISVGLEQEKGLLEGFLFKRETCEEGPKREEPPVTLRKSKHENRGRNSNTKLLATDQNLEKKKGS